jgi:ribokinase
MKLLVFGSFVQACCWKVDRLPSPGETLVATALSIEAGGKGLNVAIGSRRLDAQATVDVVLGVGRDTAADDLLKLLAVEGVGTQHIHRLAAQSGYGSGHIAANGENAIAVFPGPNLLLTAYHADLACDAIAAADVVYGQFETSLVVLTRAFSLAKSSKLSNGLRKPLTVLNPSPWQPIPSELMSCIDVMVVNEVEAAALLQLPHALSGLDLKAAAQVIHSHLDSFWSYFKGKLLVVTLGDQGSLAFSPELEPILAPAFPIQAVDTVGAGDAFASALCVALANREMPMALALQQANACGAMVAKQFGVLDVLPKLDDLKTFLQDLDS